MRIAFYLPGNIPVYTFSLMLGISAALGLAWVAWRAPVKFTRQHVNAGLWVLFGGLVGGRAAFVAASWPYFRLYPVQILEVYRGGISGIGALVGGVLALALASRLIRLPLGRLADALLPLLAVLAVSAWLGCWLEGCAYGPPSNYWWGLPTRDEWGYWSLRWPTQLLGALLALALIWLVDWNRKENTWLGRPGRAATLGVLGLCLQIGALSYLRADPGLSWLGLRLDAWGAWGLAGLSGLVLFVSLLKRGIEGGRDLEI